MKKLLLFVFIVLPFLCTAQTNLQYDSVVQVNADANTLYHRSLNFMAHVFTSANDVVQLKDENTKKVVGKGLFLLKTKPALMGGTGGTLYFTVEIQSKDNRFRYVINDLDYEFPLDGGQTMHLDLNAEKNHIFSKKKWADAKQEVNNNLQSFIQSMTSYMSGKSDSQKDNW